VKADTFTLANAAISYTYTKDVILSPAGIFYATALTVAVKALISTGTVTAKAKPKTSAWASRKPAETKQEPPAFNPFQDRNAF